METPDSESSGLFLALRVPNRTKGALSLLPIFPLVDVVERRGETRLVGGGVGSGGNSMISIRRRHHRYFLELPESVTRVSLDVGSWKQTEFQLSIQERPELLVIGYLSVLRFRVLLFYSSSRVMMMPRHGTPFSDRQHWCGPTPSMDLAACCPRRVPVRILIQCSATDKVDVGVQDDELLGQALRQPATEFASLGGSVGG